MKKDLLVLTADKDAYEFLAALFLRIPKIEKIPPFSFDLIRHPRRDPGTAIECHEYIRPFIHGYDHAMVVFDHEGSGKETIPNSELTKEIENKLANNGWRDRCKCIVFEPELESWLWVNRSQLHALLEWSEEVDIYDWLTAKKFILNPRKKPVRPKEAFECLLKFKNIPKSSSLYHKISSIASYKKCTDANFEEMLNTLRQWFRLQAP
jgi:hypothetical protein